MGDAWLQPYTKDGKGANVIVVRSKVASKLIKKGIDNGHLTIDELSLERFISSQQGSYNHRHTGLSVRIKEAKKKNQPIPPKRFASERVTLVFMIVQKLRMKVRRKSLEIWAEKSDAVFFDREMKDLLKKYKTALMVYHSRRSIMRRLKK